MHILDISHSVACVLDAPRDVVHNEIFNVGSNEGNYQVRQVAEIIGSLVPGCELIFGDSSADKRNYRADFTKIHEQLPGFQCSWDVERGAKEILDIFARIGFDEELYRFRGHTRIKQIKHLLDTRADRRRLLLDLTEPMRFIPLKVPGAFRVEVEPREDERGFFARAWCAQELQDHGCEAVIAQMNLSTNLRAGTIRGLHVQAPPHGEAKFFRCIAGRSFHVVVDVRPDSPTYGQWAGVELAADRFDALYVPPYCAKGYQALEDGTVVLYGVSSPYTPGAETGIRWDDPALGIDWPITDGVIVSEKDLSWADLRLERSSS